MNHRDQLRHYSERRQAAGLDRLLDDLDGTATPLPAAVSGPAGYAAGNVLRIAREELPIPRGPLARTDKDRFFWRAGAEIDAAIAEAMTRARDDARALWLGRLARAGVSAVLMVAAAWLLGGGAN